MKKQPASPNSAIDQLRRGELLRRVEAFLKQHQANQVKNQVWFL